TVTVNITDAGPQTSQFGTASTTEDATTTVSTTTSTEDSGDTVKLSDYSNSTPLDHSDAVTYNGDGTFTYDPTNASYFETLPVGFTTATFTYAVTAHPLHAALPTSTVTVNITDAGPQTSQFGTASTTEDATTTVSTTTSTEDSGDTVKLSDYSTSEIGRAHV